MVLSSLGVNLKKIAKVYLAKGWAYFVGGRNPKWPPSAILTTGFSTVWPTVLSSICFQGFLGSRNTYSVSVLSSDYSATMKSKMAAVGRLENPVFNGLANSDDQHMLSGVIGVKEFISDANFIIQLLCYPVIHNVCCLSCLGMFLNKAVLFMNSYL